MNQFFDVGNKNKNGCFISAKDKNDAVRVAIGVGHVKEAAHARVNEPLDMSKDTAYSSLKEILESGKSGQLYKLVPCMNAMAILSGKKVGQGKWLLKEV